MVILFHFESQYPTSFSLKHIYPLDQTRRYNLRYVNVDITSIDETGVDVSVHGYPPLHVPYYPYDDFPAEEEILHGHPYAPKGSYVGIWAPHHAFIAFTFDHLKSCLRHLCSTRAFPFLYSYPAGLFHSFILGPFAEEACLSKEDYLEFLSLLPEMVEQEGREGHYHGCIEDLLALYKSKGKALGVEEKELFHAFAPYYLDGIKEEDIPSYYSQCKEDFSASLSSLSSLDIKRMIMVKTHYEGYDHILSTSLKHILDDGDEELSESDYREVYNWIIQGEYKDISEQDMLMVAAKLMAKINKEMRKLKGSYTETEYYAGDYHDEWEEVTKYYYDAGLCRNYFDEQLEKGNPLALAMKEKFPKE